MDNEILNSDSDNNKIEIELINVPKFILLHVLSGGLYGLWWIYKSWKFFKVKEASDIWPIPRAIFSIFFVGLLFDKIQKFAKSNGYLKGYSSTGLYMGYILLGIILTRLPDPYWMIALLTVIFLIPPLKALNFAIEKSDQYIVKRRTGFNNRQIVIIGIFGIFWILILLGFFMPVEEL